MHRCGFWLFVQGRTRTGSGWELGHVVLSVGGVNWGLCAGGALVLWPFSSPGKGEVRRRDLRRLEGRTADRLRRFGLHASRGLMVTAAAGGGLLLDRRWSWSLQWRCGDPKRPVRFKQNGLLDSHHGLVMETSTDSMPSRFQASFRYRGRLRRFPMTFEDSDMLRASQGFTILRPSR